MSEPIIQVDNLGKSYQIRHQAGGSGPGQLLSEQMANWLRGRWNKSTIEEFWALRGISFELQRGEVLGVIGRNGAGKSTLLKVLSRITDPTEGRASLRGRVASLLEVGTGFHPELTGRENIFLNGAILGMSRQEIRAKFDEIVAFSEVEQFLDTPVKRYSSGMYVRLAFAVAAHLEPEILIVDEVLAVGDIAFQKKCLGKMQDVARGDQRTVLFVSHDMNRIQSLCDRALYLRQGRVVVDGATPDVVREYLADMRQSGDARSSLELSKMKPAKSKGQQRVFQSLRLEGEALGAQEVKVGAAVNLDLELDVPKGTDIKIQLRNEEGAAVVNFHSEIQSGLRLEQTGPVKLRCHVPALSIWPGDYTIDLMAICGYDVVELLENVGTVHVAFADLYGTGRLTHRKDGLVLVASQWEVV